MTSGNVSNPYTGLDYINELITCFVSKTCTQSNKDLLDILKRDYQARMLEETKGRREGDYKPDPLNHAGFEYILSLSLFNEINMGRKCIPEWPYVSNVKSANAKSKVDLMVLEEICDLPYEIWIELGMFADDQLNKYKKKDICNLMELVDECKYCVGVSLHFRLYDDEDKDVPVIYDEFVNNQNYSYIKQSGEHKGLLEAYWLIFANADSELGNPLEI